MEEEKKELSAVNEKKNNKLIPVVLAVLLLVGGIVAYLTVFAKSYIYVSVQDNQTKIAITKEGIPESIPETPEISHMIFDGWYIEDTDQSYDFITPIEKDTNVVARFTPCYYVTFVQGHELEDILCKVPMDSPFSILSNPIPATVEGFAFAGWYDEDNTMFNPDTVFNKDVTITAKWLKCLTVTFRYPDGNEVLIGVDEGECIDEMPPVPVQEGDIFKCWSILGASTDDWMFNPAKPIYTDMELIPCWLPKYRVTFNPDNGEETIVTVAYESIGLIAPETPKKTGYTFKGWYDGSHKFESGSVIEEPTDFTAKWSMDTVVKFPADKQSVDLGKTKTIAAVIEGDIKDKTLTYKSSDTKIASVDKKTGEVKGLKTGSVTITATATDKTKATYTLYVNNTWVEANVTFYNNSGTLWYSPSMSNGSWADVKLKKCVYKDGSMTYTDITSGITLADNTDAFALNSKNQLYALESTAKIDYPYIRNVKFKAEGYTSKAVTVNVAPVIKFNISSPGEKQNEVTFNCPMDEDYYISIRGHLGGITDIEKVVVSSYGAVTDVKHTISSVSFHQGNTSGGNGPCVLTIYTADGQSREIIIYPKAN
ncbi:MAG: InlB B-repeat-containing protein [Erysipelotrichaceae bacterium]|nr:InlB B-repeat-containing protein [Erysipelotrichaceae bacterium]